VTRGTINFRKFLSVERLLSTLSGSPLSAADAAADRTGLFILDFGLTKAKQRYSLPSRPNPLTDTSGQLFPFRQFRRAFEVCCSLLPVPYVQWQGQQNGGTSPPGRLPSKRTGPDNFFKSPTFEVGSPRSKPMGEKVVCGFGVACREGRMATRKVCPVAPIP
jgi:hypothetical protein